MDGEQACPICERPTSPSPRYPNYLCRLCADGVTDSSGRHVHVGNITPMGTGTGAAYDDGSAADLAQASYGLLVYRNGVLCEANEAYFGGIVTIPAIEVDADPLIAARTEVVRAAFRSLTGTGWISAQFAFYANRSLATRRVLPDDYSDVSDDRPDALLPVWESLHAQMATHADSEWTVSTLRIDVAGAWTFAFN